MSLSYKTIIDYKDPNLSKDTNYRNTPIVSYKQVYGYYYANYSKEKLFPVWNSMKKDEGGTTAYIYFSLFTLIPFGLDVLANIFIIPINIFAFEKVFASNKIEVHLYGKLVDMSNNPIKNYPINVIVFYKGDYDPANKYTVTTDNYGIFDYYISQVNTYTKESPLIVFEFNDYDVIKIEYSKPFSEGTRFITKKEKGIIESKLKTIGNVIVLKPKKSIGNTTKKNINNKKKHNKK